MSSSHEVPMTVVNVPAQVVDGLPGAATPGPEGTGTVDFDLYEGNVRANQYVVETARTMRLQEIGGLLRAAIKARQANEGEL